MKKLIVAASFSCLLFTACIFGSGKKEKPEDPPISILDTDKDGVSDEMDRCPDQAGTVANNGCPEVANPGTTPPPGTNEPPTKMKRKPSLPGIDTVGLQ